MNVFVSYAREDAKIAERIVAALCAAGFYTFQDIKDLPPGEEFNVRIRSAINSADIFVFLASSHSLRPGAYALTELLIAKSKWPNPHGYVLPVLLNRLDPARLPAYLRPINALYPAGNIEAEIVSWMEQRAVHGTTSEPGTLKPQERFLQWAKRTKPPVRNVKINMRLHGLFSIFFGLIIMSFVFGFGLFAFMSTLDFPPSSRPPVMLALFLIGLFSLMGLIGVVLTINGIKGVLKGYKPLTIPVAALVLDRVEQEYRLKIHIQTIDGNRMELQAMQKSLRKVYLGDIGWAYIKGDKLFEFVVAKPNLHWKDATQDGD